MQLVIVVSQQYFVTLCANNLFVGFKQDKVNKQFTEFPLCCRQPPTGGQNQTCRLIYCRRLNSAEYPSCPMICAQLQLTFSRLDPWDNICVDLAE